ncbi:MAG: hypothetical protein EA421_09205 [Gemmatimonadales bacterium]|nr:MAG: hypothetical protein EA421_09205 [Gemmatimonadales bacterium]
MNSPTSDSILTLEPLLEAVQDGLASSGWELSGLQKTTSREFEGRWAGESTRSAYLFFHRSDLPDSVSVESFLDETSRGLKGNLSLVVDGPRLHEVGALQSVLQRLATATSETLPPGYRTPISARVVLDDPDTPPGDGEVQVRIRLLLPRAAMDAGASAVSALVSGAVSAFERLLERPEVAELLPPVMD